MRSQSAIDDAIDALEHEVHANASTVLAAADVSVDWEQVGVSSGAFGEVYKGSLRLRLDRKSKNHDGGCAQLEDEAEHQDEYVDVGVKLSKGFVQPGLKGRLRSRGDEVRPYGRTALQLCCRTAVWPYGRMAVGP